VATKKFQKKSFLVKIFQFIRVVTNSPLGFVKDGTSCGEGRVCIRTVCLPLAQVSPSVKCPSSGSNISQCSGHGVKIIIENFI